MHDRFSPLAPLLPAVAVIVFAAAGAAAQSVVRPPNEIEDVQVGEKGPLLRVAILCRDDCRLGARSGGVFYLPGVDARLDIDLAGRSEMARSLTVTPAEGGSILKIDTAADVLRASIRKCAIGAGEASCIDLEFGDRTSLAAAEHAGGQESGPRVAIGEPRRLTADDAAAPPQSAPAAPPALREAPDEAMLSFARFAPPERLEPPAAERGAAKPSQASLTVRKEGGGRRPVVREEQAKALIGADVDIAARAGEILERRFGVAECEGARARLRADAWALDAMVDVGFCAAIAGDLEEADGVFTRLLAYTPDNYEALVGRALIAAKTGERGVARKYFQDALNALPPIAESDRIVEAMAQL